MVGRRIPARRGKIGRQSLIPSGGKKRIVFRQESRPTRLARKKTFPEKEFLVRIEKEEGDRKDKHKMGDQLSTVSRGVFGGNV